MVDVVAALIWRDEKFLICQRPPDKARPLLWEFVGGKLEAGETLEEALRRECREELDIDIEVGAKYVSVEHIYPDISVRLTLFNAKIVANEPKLLEHVDMRWISPDEIDCFDFCPADVDILAKIKEDFPPSPADPSY
ncbi:MAG: (deoxy)nucleoside triphosphate pyrophosphohydrolase [Clostridiales bacterium]|jgi:8-oxo-dGTP diphosphatase|nr:(deoxy)nucleoside triphosphate pyrophosphohydrolase [Clostridiales bacterium]